MALITGFCPQWTVVCSLVRPFIQQTFTEEQPCAVSVLLQEVVGVVAVAPAVASTVFSAGDLVGQAGTLWTQPRASATWGDLEGGGHGPGKRRPQMAPSLATDASKLTLGPQQGSHPLPSPIKESPQACPGDACGEGGLQDKQAEGRYHPPASGWSLMFTGG